MENIINESKKTRTHTYYRYLVPVGKLVASGEKMLYY